MSASTVRLRAAEHAAPVTERPQLSARILSLPPGELLVVNAAPGYGVTTALRQAVALSGDPVHWVTAGSGATDDQIFGALCAQVHVDAGLGVDALLDRLEAGGPAWLIVDDVDPRVAPEFVRGLANVAEHLPVDVRVIISSHYWLGALPRAHRLAEADLVFTDDEAMALVMAHRPHLDIDEVDQIVRVSQGWAAALVAAGRSGGTATAAWLREQGARELFDPWFATLTAEQRGLLLETRVLGLLCAGNVTAVSGRDDAAAILRELAASHAYLAEVTPAVADTGPWWSRHGLLSAYLDQIAGSDTVAAHSRAADWYLDTDDIDAVMRHLLAAGRLQDASRYLTDHESTIFSRGGDADQLMAWYDQMHPSIDDHFLHLLRIGWGQVLGLDITGADATVDRLRKELAEHADLLDAGRVVGVDPAQPGSQLSAQVAETAVLKAYLAQFHADPAVMVTNGRRLAVEPPEQVNPESVQLAPVLIARGLIWSGQPEAAATLLAAAADRPQSNDMLRETQFAAAAALSDTVNGRVRRARARTDAMVRWLEHSGLPAQTRLVGPVRAVRAEVGLELGDLEGAFHDAAEAVRDAASAQLMGEVAWAHMVLARCHLAAGDFGAALRALNDAREAATCDVPDSLMVIAVDLRRAEVHLAAGDVGRAVRLLRALPPSDTRSLLWARAGLIGQPAVARRTLEGLHATTPRIEAGRHATLAALYARMSRRMSQGHLRKAASVAATHGIGQLLTGADPALVALAESTALEYQDDNLLWLLDTKGQRRPDRVPTGGRVALSRGEMQLLAMLPSRSKNAEIAQSMGVSINTVKTRLRRLYAKLGANNRDEAISLARQRGLLN